MFEKAKAKVKELGKKAADTIVKVANWCAENPVAVAFIATSTTAVLKQGTKMYAEHAEMVRRDRDFYDPRLGMHVFARRKLTPKEQVIVEARYKSGESYAKIFYEMGLL